MTNIFTREVLRVVGKDAWLAILPSGSRTSLGLNIQFMNNATYSKAIMIKTHNWPFNVLFPQLLPQGENVTNWPFSSIDFDLICVLLNEAVSNFEPWVHSQLP